MAGTPPLPPTQNRLWLPRLSLTRCLRAVMTRSTMGVALSDAQRFNYFPASPLCSLSLWFEGEALQLPFAAPVTTMQGAAPMPARIIFGGPHNRPSVTWNTGPGHGMMLVVMPDALQALTGVQPDAYLNRLVDAQTVLPPEWMAMCQALMQPQSDTQRVARVEDFLEPLWRQARPSESLTASRYEDWAQGLALRAATSGLGRSVRQVERRIKQWAGQPLRELRGISRAEKAFFDALTADHERRISLSALAADNGYADQSHLTRETRRITGFAPEELRKRIQADEAFWSYRLWQ